MLFKSDIYGLLTPEQMKTFTSNIKILKCLIFFVGIWYFYKVYGNNWITFYLIQRVQMANINRCPSQFVNASSCFEAWSQIRVPNWVFSEVQ
jgi:hypothetical protein